jgi:ABC-type branched-subunit amino acid transport system substrate-binding protein
MIALLTRLWTVAVFALPLAGCGPFFDENAERRSLYAKQSDGPVVIALVDGDTDTGFVNGVRLAIKEVMSSQGGILGRPVELIVRPGADNFDDLRPTIQRIANNPAVTAALGHAHPGVAVPASVIYERSRVLFMPAFDTTEELTRHGFNFVLRMLPDNRVMAAQTASVADLFGYKRIVVLHQAGDYDRDTAYLFEDLARFFGIDVPFHGSFFSAEPNYRRLINEFGGADFDAIFLAADTEPGARMLRQLRELGIRKPVLGSLKLNLGPLRELSKEAGDLTIVPTVFGPDGNNPLRQRFAESYLKTFGIESSQSAAQGFDSVKILAEIIRRAGSTEPRALANTAHFTGPMAGVTGIYAFDEAGNLKGKSYRFQVLRRGRWEPLPGMDLPFLLQRFETGVDPADEVTSALVLSQPERDRLPPTLNGNHTSDSQGAGTAGRDESRLPDASTSPLAADFRAGALEPPDTASVRPHVREDLRLHERNLEWLAMAQRILAFKRLGLVVRSSETGGAAALALARDGADRLGFELEVCEVPELNPRNESAGERRRISTAGVAPPLDSSLGASDTEGLPAATRACYGRLASTVDSVYVPGSVGVDAGGLRQITRALRRFGVSSFAINRALEDDSGLTLTLESRNLDLDDPSVAANLNGLLRSTSLQALEREIWAVPSLSMNLRAFGDLGLSPSPLSLALVSKVLDEKQPGREISSLIEAQ